MPGVTFHFHGDLGEIWDQCRVNCFCGSQQVAALTKGRQDTTTPDSTWDMELRHSAWLTCSLEANAKLGDCIGQADCSSRCAGHWQRQCSWHSVGRHDSFKSQPLFTCLRSAFDCLEVYTDLERVVAANVATCQPSFADAFVLSVLTLQALRTHQWQDME